MFVYFYVSSVVYVLGVSMGYGDLTFVSESVLCNGKRVTLIQKTYLEGGRVVLRDVVRFGEAVAVLPIKDNGNVVLLSQFRVPVNDWVLEIPAGRIEEGEDLVSAARRELREEAGYDADKLIKVASVYTAPGYSDEILHIFLARKLKYVGASPEPGELIRTIELSVEEAIKTLIKSKHVDAKTLLAILLFKTLNLSLL
ncbi:MAG: NUDIX hydrolase [Desulfurococcaceae archaeon TW002]